MPRQTLLAGPNAAAEASMKDFRRSLSKAWQVVVSKKTSMPLVSSCGEAGIKRCAVRMYSADKQAAGKERPCTHRSRGKRAVAQTGREQNNPPTPIPASCSGTSATNFTSTLCRTTGQTSMASLVKEAPSMATIGWAGRAPVMNRKTSLWRASRAAGGIPTAA